MARKVSVAGFTVLLAMSSASLALACGDKFLVQGSCCVGGSRFDRIHAAAHPAAILIVRSPDSKAIEAVTHADYQSTLREVGNSVAICGDASRCAAEAQSGKIDVVLADARDAPKLEELFRSVTPRPVVVPVTYKAAKSEVTELKAQYGHYFNAPSRPDRLAELVDEVMGQQP